ncbi:MAG TPA: hypothetical protein ENJ01_10060 [Gammaproteobacteria bacterium]|nr:hypothetical protein [Gammaproteobacteria bacterium]
MNESSPLLLSALAIIAGVLVIVFKRPLGAGATRLYRRLGIDVPESLYIRQFVFVGVLLMILGFLLGTGLFALL